MAVSSEKANTARPGTNSNTMQQTSNPITNKKTRKNPARRKTERLNSGAQPSASQLKTKPASGQSKDYGGSVVVSPGKAFTTAAGSPTAKINAGPKAVPAKLSRQVSAPSVLNSAKTSTTTTKPLSQSRKSAAAASSPFSTLATNTTDPKSNSSSSSSNAITPKPKPKPKSQIPKEPRSNPNKTQSPLASTTKSTLPNPKTAPYLTTGSLLGTLTTLAFLPLIHATHDLGGPPAALATALSARLTINNLLEELITSLRAGTYSADEALDVLRRGALGYAGEIQDGERRVEVVRVVEGVAGEVERVRRTRGAEWGGVVRGFVGGSLSDDNGDGGKRGEVAVTTAVGREVGLARLGALVAGAVGDVLGRNPGLGPVRDGAVRALGERAFLGSGEREMERTARVNLVVRHR